MMLAFRYSPRAIALSAVITCTVIAGHVKGDTSNTQRDLSRLFEEGLRQYDAHRYEEARNTFAAIRGLDTTDPLNVVINLAQCEAALGQWHTATELLQSVLPRTEAELRAAESQRRDTVNLRSRLHNVRVSLAALARLRSYVTIVVPDQRTLTELKVELDQVNISPERFGKPIPINRGRHALFVSARGKLSLTEMEYIEEPGTTLRIIVRLQDRERVPLHTDLQEILWSRLPLTERSIRICLENAKSDTVIAKARESRQKFDVVTNEILAIRDNGEPQSDRDVARITGSFSDELGQLRQVCSVDPRLLPLPQSGGCAGCTSGRGDRAGAATIFSWCFGLALLVAFSRFGRSRRF